MANRPQFKYEIGMFNWQDKANCADTDTSWFYSGNGSTTSGKGDNEKYLPGKYLCADCEVREHCLETALKNKEPYGIWGGLTTRERAKLQRARRSESIGSEGRDSSPTNIKARNPLVAETDPRYQEPPQKRVG